MLSLFLLACNQPTHFMMPNQKNAGKLLAAEELHEPEGKCHTPEKNPCYHVCHHAFCKCGKACVPKCKDSKDENCMSQCTMSCFGDHARCFEECDAPKN